MASYYWLKLWLDMLDDRTVVQMDDQIWRKFVEFLLVAKEYNQDGELPDTETITFRLRCPKEHVENALKELTKLGFLIEDKGHWILKNFAKRQERQSSSERGKQYRERKGTFNSTEPEQEPNDPLHRTEVEENQTREDKEESISKIIKKMDLSIPKRKELLDWIDYISYSNGAVKVFIKPKDKVITRWSGVDGAKFIKAKYGALIANVVESGKVEIIQSE